MTDIPHILGGRYEVGDLIGRGGMAQVHLGYDKRLSRTVAIKVLRYDLASDPTFLARFRREAQSAASLNHPAIVAVYDTGEEQVKSPSGRPLALPYIVMEYVKGRTVAKLLRHGQALPINEAVQITVGVLSALEYSHYEGIVHRDIKPGNIMITHDGKVKVMDFGIARALADSSATMTSTNSVVGTAQYLSPEQARGEVVDARSDLYSTGCLLYELLTGKPPFQGDSAVAVAYQHVSEMPKPPSQVAPDIPEPLDRVVMKSLAKNREERYQSAADMRNDLLSAVRGDQISAPAIGTWQTTLHNPAVQPAATIVADQPAHTTQTMPAARPLPQDAPSVYSPASADLDNSTDDEEDEEAARKKKKKKIAAIVAVVIVVLLAISGLTAAIVFSGKSDEPQRAVTMVEVPDLTGMNEQAATTALENVGLKIVVGDEIPDDKVPEGEFLSSDPQAGESVKKGSEVVVHFSAGPDEATVPDLAGLTEDSARQQLEALGIAVSSVEIKDAAGIEKGKVIGTDPAAGSTLNLQNKPSITLYVASGEVELDSLVGRSLGQAQAALNELKLQFDITHVNSSEPADTVIEQEPGAGKQPISTRVKITVSDGPAETQEEPAEKPDPSPTDPQGVEDPTMEIPE